MFIPSPGHSNDPRLRLPPGADALCIEALAAVGAELPIADEARGTGAVIAEHLAAGLPWVRDADTLVRYPLRRAPALAPAQAVLVLDQLRGALVERLPAAYVEEVVCDDFVELVEHHLAQPVLAVLQSQAPHVLEDFGEPLADALISGAIEDLGEVFVAQVERRIEQVLVAVAGLIAARNGACSAEEEVRERISSLERALSSLPRTASTLFDWCDDTPVRDERTRDILTPLGYGWILD